MSKGVREYVKEVRRVYEDRRKRVFESMARDWRVFLAYFKIADLLEHVYIAKNLRGLRRVYFVLDDLAGELQRRVSEDTVFLVVSDHGMKPLPDGTGNHSYYGFYSLNFKTYWEPKDVIDFHQKL